ncbi:MAG: hypothetical protein ACRENJ_01690 [Candidatus Eiseniibacteriota bacterium]
MSLLFWIGVALFVITDIVFILFVIRRFRANLLGAAVPGANQGQILQAAHAMVGEYLRANYSGDPGHLATALGGLLPRLRELVVSHGVEPRREVLHALIEVSAEKHRIASAREIRQALAAIG